MNKQNEEKLGEMIHKLRQRFVGAVQFLKETPISAQDTRQKLFSLPWFLVLGFPDSGKTSLLAQSKLDFVLSKKKPIEKNRLSHCEWWATRDAVFLDVNSAYILQNRKTKKQRKLWFDFLELVYAHRRGQPFQGVLFCIDLEKLCSTHKNERNAYFHSLRGRLKDLIGYSREPFSLYFVLTKVDKLAGFSEFFDMLTKEEAAQLCGITFSQAQILSTQVMADAFDLEFDNLLLRLNQSVIQRLHNERNVDKRAIIKDFPLQLESIKKSLAAFLQNISDISSFKQLCQLRGLYLSAATPQSDAKLDRLVQPLSQTFALQEWVPETEVSNYRAYFTRGIFKQVLADRALVLTMAEHGKAKFTFYLQWSIVAICILVGVSLVGTWVHHFSRNLADLNAIEQAMAQYQVMLTSEAPLDSHVLTAQIAKLSDASTHAQDAYIEWAIRTFLPDDAGVYQNANHVFKETVQLTVAKQLQQFLKTQLHVPDKINLNQFYAALRAYLMLGNSAQFNLSALTEAFDASWTPAINATDLAQLNGFMSQAFAQHTDLTLDTQLIKESRSWINQRPKPELARALFLLNGANNQSLTLKFPVVNSHPIFQSGASTISIPSAFTAQSFNYAYDTLSPKIANTLINGDWVTKATPSTEPITQDEVEQVRKFYISNYISIWENILSQLQLTPFTSYDQAIGTISSLTQPNSPLLQLIYQLIINTNVTYHNAPTPISLTFASFTQSSNQVLAENRNNLLQLITSLSAITQDRNPATAAFEVVKIHTTVPKQQSDAFDALNMQVPLVPYPYNHWFHDINKFSWQLILNDAQKAINQVWQSTIYPDFTNNMAALYPFNAAAKQDMTFDDFNHFFSPRGRLNSFISFYLTPFVDTAQTPWQLKSFSDSFLPISANVLEQLQQAVSVTQLFFPHESEQMSLPFLFRPLQLSSNIKQVDISIDNQTAEYSPDFMVATHFDWPSKSGAHYIAMVLSDKDGKEDTVNLAGSWALFHWLDSLASPAQPGSATFSFQNPPYVFNFQLMDDKGLHPLSFVLLHGFTLPSTLYTQDTSKY